MGLQNNSDSYWDNVSFRAIFFNDLDFIINTLKGGINSSSRDEGDHNYLLWLALFMGYFLNYFDCLCGKDRRKSERHYQLILR